MSIFWDPSYSVEVKELDEQHQEFIKILNNFYNSLYQEESREELGESLNRLIDYAENHFATEEKYFDLYGYELAEEHKNEHRKFKAKVLDFKNRFQAGEEVTLELVDFLEDWLIDHLGNQDKKYIECFHQHGLY